MISEELCENSAISREVADRAMGLSTAAVSSLCAHVKLHASRRGDSSPLTADDFDAALHTVLPFSLGLLHPTIPLVRFADVGGLNDVKVLTLILSVTDVVSATSPRNGCMALPEHCV